MKDSIRQFLNQNRASVTSRDFSDDESLLEAGIIDSVAMLDLIAFLEKSYGIKISEDDMTPENFDSVNAITSFVSARQS